MDLSDEELKKIAGELEEVERDRNAGKKGYTIEELDRAIQSIWNNIENDSR